MNDSDKSLKPILFISGSKITRKSNKVTLSKEKQTSSSIEFSIGMGLLPLANIKYRIPQKETKIEKHTEIQEYDSYINLQLEEFNLGPAVDVINYLHLPKELNFPPGHPMPDKFYKTHPINKNTYIPSEIYDETLYREREAELIRLLVDLGATKINITEQMDTSKNNSGKLDVAGVEAKANHESINRQNDRRIFELEGKKWDDKSEIDVKSYLWLDYEPSWRSVVHARQVGLCKTASIELEKETSYSISASLGIKKDILNKLGISQVGLSAEHQKTGMKKYLIYAEFNNLK